MALYKAKTRKDLGGEAPFILMTKGEKLDSIGGKRIKDVPYVQLRGMAHGNIDVFIREDLLKRV